MDSLFLDFYSCSTDRAYLYFLEMENDGNNETLMTPSTCILLCKATWENPWRIYHLSICDSEHRESQSGNANTDSPVHLKINAVADASFWQQCRGLMAIY